MEQKFTAKTVEDAKALAARTFGVAESELEFQILEESKKGFLGLGSKDAVILAILPEEQPVPDAPVETSAPETVSFEEELPEQPSIVADFTEASASEANQPEEIIDPEPVADLLEEIIDPEPVADPPEEIADPAEKSAVPHDEELVSGEPSPEALAKIEKAKNYLLNVLGAMGVQAELEVSAGSESAVINIHSHSSGTIIGKRGETLDALQYLIFMIANRGEKDYYRIILNSADYRERRRKTLEELAAKIARNVLKTGRSTTLEPMNPYERRIIHSAVSEIEGVNSKSIGEEPHRKVVISSVNRPPKFNNKSHKPSGRSGRRDGGRPPRRKNQDVSASRISMDSMKTSFEKDYKRPKPEDDINAGLYGKIEI